MTSNLKTVAVIPARGGSKRVKNKNLRPLATIPLIAYSIITARQLEIPVFVTSDSNDILKQAIYFGATPIKRPSELSTDTSPDIGWMNHFLEFLQKKRYYSVENIVFLRPTTPIRALETIKRGIGLFSDDASSLRSIQPLPEAPEKCFRVENGYLVSAINQKGLLNETNLPNQAFQTAYTGNGYLDIIRPKTVFDTNSLYGDKIQAFITEPTVDIDDLNDFKYAEYLIGRG